MQYTAGTLGGVLAMRPKGPAEVILARRKKAIELLKQHLSLNEIARRIECNASSVMRWRDRWNEHGEEGLRVLASPGRPPRLTRRQKDQLLRYLLKGPLEFGWKTDVWTTRRISTLIERKFRVRYHFTHAGRLMHALGWSPQKPERRALERNEAAIQKWKETTWKQVKKTPRGWAPT
jgi:transposase